MDLGDWDPGAGAPSLVKGVRARSAAILNCCPHLRCEGGPEAGGAGASLHGWGGLEDPASQASHRKWAGTEGAWVEVRQAPLRASLIHHPDLGLVSFKACFLEDQSECLEWLSGE